MLFNSPEFILIFIPIVLLFASLTQKYISKEANIYLIILSFQHTFVEYYLVKVSEEPEIDNNVAFYMDYLHIFHPMAFCRAVHMQHTSLCYLKILKRHET